MLSGCLTLSDARASYQAEAKPDTPSRQHIEGLAQCQAEVAALAQYDHSRFSQQNAALNTLMDRSARYLLTRPKLSADMHTTLDSVYQAELAKRCHQIHSELFGAILAQAEGE